MLEKAKKRQATTKKKKLERKQKRNVTTLNKKTDEIGKNKHKGRRMKGIVINAGIQRKWMENERNE